jgi:hypothetical protein
MSSWITSNSVTDPALEVVHITGIALLVGNLVSVGLRVRGWGAARCPCLPWRSRG